MARMLSKVPDNMDKREGSIIYDALAPVAIELAETYIQLDAVLNESFADTQSREYLIRRVAERGLSPTPATNAVLKGVFTPSTLEIKMNARFNLDDLNYKVIKKIENGVYELECEAAGTVGNEKFGNVIPIDYISGLETAKITELLVPGEDEESTEDLRKRYFDSFEKNAYGGNIADYIEKTNALPGVGSTKVTPVWNGGGTVLLTILDSEFSPASTTLIQNVQTAIDPRGDASGVGIAPIGHVVTVRTADTVEINVASQYIFSKGFSFTTAKPKIEQIINDYLFEVRSDWAKNDYSVVRTLQIEARLLTSVDGLLDVVKTKLNGKQENLTLGTYEIPVLGVVTNDSESA
jgi:uncharacterized phage protein gp47/JayE